MQRLSRTGLAGVPGVSLSKRDRRAIAARLGVGRAGSLGAAPGCVSCGSVESGVAAEVARHLGSPELAKAALDPGQAEVLRRAAVLASATFDVTKFRKDRLAVLAGVGGPKFAQVVSKSAAKLGNNDEAFRGALVVVFLTGALDDQSGRQTELADAYRKVLKQFAVAAKASGKSQALAGLGIPPSGDEGYRKSSYADVVPLPSVLSPEIDSTSWMSKPMYAPWRGRQVSASNDPSSYWPPARSKNPADVGSPLVSPDAIDTVPSFQSVSYLWTWLVKPASDAAGDWDANKRQARLVAAVANARRFALDAERVDPSSSPDNAAKRLAAWIVRFYADTVTTWPSSNGGIAWGEFPGMPGGAFGASPDLKGAGGSPGGFRGGGLPDGLYGWVALHLRRFVAVGTSPGQLADIAASRGTTFPMRVAALLRLASKQALARTGQVGSYDTIGYWKPGSGSEQVPPGPGAAYASVASWPKPSMGAVVLWQHVDFAAEVYRGTYRKEPTDHALLWFGSFGYATGSPEYIARIAATEALRMAGSVPTAADLVDQTNLFMALFQTIGPALAVTLDWVNKGIQAAIDALCTVFKVTMGPDVGGVVCKVFEALLKFIGGVVKGNIASIAALAKALLGFIGKLQNSDFMGALVELFTGVNTSIFFLVGGSFADFIGVPFLISNEKPQTSLEYMPSMERMGAELSRENPFFLITLVTAVFTVLATKGSPVSVAAVIIALAPVFGMLLAPSIRKGLQTVQEPSWMAQFRGLSVTAVRGAVESMVRVCAGIVMGVMTAKDAARKVGDSYKAFAKKKGLSATTQTVTFLVQNLTVKLTNYTVYIYTSVSSRQGFNLKDLSVKTLDLFGQLLVLIPIFAEQAGFDEAGIKAAQELATTGLSVTEEAKKGILDLFAELEPKDRAALLAEMGTSASAAGGGGGAAASAAPAWRTPALIGLAAVAGLTIGIAVFGGRKAKA